MRMAFVGSLIVSGLVFVLSAQVWAGEAKEPDKTIVEIAAGNKDFTKLVAAVKAAGLVETLSGPGPFTVFAPTDAAFEALGENTLKALLADKKKLTAILTYHVIAAKVPAAAAINLAKDGKSAKTVNGAEIKLSLKGKDLYLNEHTKVIATDIFAKNGVVHVIDKVLIPPAPTPGPADAIRLIEKCLDVGVARYNAGHHRECAIIYQQAVAELLKMSPDVMPTNAQRRLNLALSHVNVCSQPRESAWALRYALDEVYDMMLPLNKSSR